MTGSMYSTGHLALPRPIHGLFLLMAGWLLVSAPAPSAVAEEAYWPQSLKAQGAPPTSPSEFVSQCLTNYRRELEAMRQCYEEQCGGVPSKLDMFFSAAAMPTPPSFTVKVEGELDSPWSAYKEQKGKTGTLLSLGAEWLHPGRPGSRYRLPISRTWVPTTKPSDKHVVRGGALRQFLAGDGLTSDLTGSPRCVVFGLRSTAGVIESREHTGPKGRKHIDESYRTDRNYVGRFDTQWDSGLTGERRGSCTRVFGVDPGVHEIYAIGHNVYESTTEKCPRRVKLDSQVRFHIAWINVFRAVRIGLRGVDMGQDKRRLSLVHLVRAGQSTAGRCVMSIEPMVELKCGGGKHVQRLGMDKLRVEVLSGSTFRIQAEHGRIGAHYGGGVGETKFRLETVSSGDHRLRSKVYTLAANELSMVVAPEPAVTALSAGTAYEVKVVAKGPGDMEDYKVHWHPLETGRGKALGCQVAGDWGKFGSFRKQNAQTHVASTRLLVDPQSLKSWLDYDLKLLLSSLRPCRDGESVKIEADVRPTWREHGGIALGLRSFLSLVPPPITGIQLFARRRSDVGRPWLPAPASFDLFMPSREAVRTVEFHYRVQFDDGTVVDRVLPGFCSAIACRMARAVGFSLDKGKLTWSSHATGGMSKTQIHAVIRNDGAYSWSRLVLKPGVEELTTQTVEATGNRAVLTSKAETGNVEYQLFAFGPADMSQYRARWNLKILNPRTANPTLTKNFLPTGKGAFMSTTDMGIQHGVANGFMKEVAIVPSTGNPVCEIGGGPDLNIGSSLRMYVAEKAPTGSRMIIVAEARHLHFDLLSRLRCRCSVSPAVGAFESSETLLTPMGGGVYRSTGMLKLRKSPKDIGSRPKVDVELVMGD